MKFNDNQISTLIKYYREKLSNIYDINEVNAIIYIVFEDLLGLNKTDILKDPEHRINESDLIRINKAFKRIAVYEPVQYVLGKTYFCDLTFIVNNNVLIPRPETEELVRIIINDHKDDLYPSDIIDIGTGSGCIAVSLKKYLSASKTTAIDVSETALEIAKKNAEINNTEVEFICTDILNNPKNNKLETFDVIVSNPPYVLQSEKLLMNKNVTDFEPSLALYVSDENPLIYYKAIIEFSTLHLKKGGNIYLEINENKSEEIKIMLLNSGYKDIKILKDIHDKNRFISAKK
ncbi:MAG: peptide chain release factor N(5)-glutamine methyltransferase [Bacteroidota bacterium]|nr:peptide chain release factor N(5)-glutamine methyltransferase [Bacteroidota bacterium]